MSSKTHYTGNENQILVNGKKQGIIPAKEASQRFYTGCALMALGTVAFWTNYITVYTYVNIMLFGVLLFETGRLYLCVLVVGRLWKLDDYTVVEIPLEYREFAQKKLKVFYYEMVKSFAFVFFLAIVIQLWNGRLNRDSVFWFVEYQIMTLLLPVSYLYTRPVVKEDVKHL